MTIGSDTSEATDVATVRVFKLPLVDRPSRALNIQKKLLLTWSANSAPDAMASPTTTGATLREPRIGARMPAAVGGDRYRSDRQVQHCCDEPRQQDGYQHGCADIGRKQAAKHLVKAGLADHRAQRAADASDQQDLTSGVKALVHRLAGAFEPCRGAEDQVGA